MCTGTSSPSCSNFALKKTTVDNEKGSWEKGTATLMRGNYVNDLLKALPNISESLELIQSVINMCAKGEINFTNFSSNQREALVKIPKEKRRKGVKN